MQKLCLNLHQGGCWSQGVTEDLIVRLELNLSEKLILCVGDTAVTYKLSGISLEYDTIFNEPYATTITEMYTGTTSTRTPR